MSANPNSIIEVPQSSFSRREERELPAVQGPATPMTMLAAAVQRGMEPAVLKDLMDLQERWERNEARKAYFDALAAFKANAPVIVKDKKNLQYESMYAGIGNIVNTVNPELSKFGLSAEWKVDQSSGIAVTCILTHRAGHSESVTLKGPADDSGKKNPLQQIKSTITYLKIATYESVTGIAPTDATGDDDGNGASRGEYMTEEAVIAWEKKIKATTTDKAAKAVCQEAIEEADKVNDLTAYKRIKMALADHIEFMKSVK